MKRFFLALLLFCCEDSFNSHPNLEAYWDEPPIIEICDDMPLEPDFILEQFNWYHDEISDSYLYKDVIYTSCSEPVGFGIIRVQIAALEKLEELEAGAYSFRITYEKSNHKSNLSIIAKSVINLTENNDVKVVRHEIGHAYGWRHFGDPEHLMYPKNVSKIYEWKIYGLKNYPELLGG